MLNCKCDCIANVAGECLVEICHGEIRRLHFNPDSAEKAAETYKMVSSDLEYFFETQNAYDAT